MGYKVALLLWLTYMYEPQWLLANRFRFTPAAKITTILSVLLALALLLRFRLPKIGVKPFAAIAAYVLLTYPFATNPFYASMPAKQTGLYYLLCTGVITFVRTPQQAMPFLTSLLLGQYIWWGLWGIANGRVGWHPLWANYDGFGPLVVLGIAGAFHYGMAIRNRKTKIVAFGTSVLCVLGLVASFARGAFLGGVAVLSWMWVRSPKKGMISVFAVVAVIGVVAGASLFSGTERGSTTTDFFAEMATIFSETEEGSGTTGDRQVLWAAAIDAWKEHPFVGVGGNSFGAFAATYYEAGEIGGDYVNNPLILYDRKLHSIYFQILSEYGLIGTALYAWLLVDFFRRNGKLRSAAFMANWTARGGGKLDLKWTSLGLTGVMIAYLANGAFYNMVECNLLPVTVAANALLFELSKPDPAPRRA